MRLRNNCSLIIDRPYSIYIYYFKHSVLIWYLSHIYGCICLSSAAPGTTLRATCQIFTKLSQIMVYAILSTKEIFKSTNQVSIIWRWSAQIDNIRMISLITHGTTIIILGSAAGLSIMLNIENYEHAPGPQSDSGVKVNLMFFGLKTYLIDCQVYIRWSLYSSKFNYLLIHFSASSLLLSPRSSETSKLLICYMSLFPSQMQLLLLL